MKPASYLAPVLVAFMEAGVNITINSDNMIVAGTNVHSEFEKLIHTFGLTEEQIKTLVQNAIDASFADGETKSWLSSALENRFQGN